MYLNFDPVLFSSLYFYISSANEQHLIFMMAAPTDCALRHLKIDFVKLNSLDLGLSVNRTQKNRHFNVDGQFWSIYRLITKKNISGVSVNFPICRFILQSGFHLHAIVRKKMIRYAPSERPLLLLQDEASAHLNPTMIDDAELGTTSISVFSFADECVHVYVFFLTGLFQLSNYACKAHGVQEKAIKIRISLQRMQR